jgi:hypothetical protein
VDNVNAQPRATTPALPQWPETLPMPDRDGYQYGLAFGLIRTPFTGGSVRQRRTVWSMPAQFALAFRMNTAQLGILQIFLDLYGYGWFSMDLVSGAARVMRPLSDCLAHRVRFISDPTHQLIGPNLWRVTLTAEVEAMRDPRADQIGGVTFDYVDEVTPEFTDALKDWDSLSL